MQPNESPDRDRWAEVDRFLGQMLVRPDATLDAVIGANREAGLPDIDVSALQGQMLAVLVRASGARRVLELGTLGGYSTIFMARALAEGGTVVTIEANKHHAAVARANFTRVGVADRVDLRVGPALDVLPTLSGPFDLIFIDADKGNYPGYLEQSVRLSRPGTLIIADNVVRRGAVVDPRSDDPNVIGVREFLRRVEAEPRLTATALQTVGAKGWDGLVLAVVNSA